MFERLSDKGFQIHALHHAEAILRHDMGSAIDELESVLYDISIPVESLIRSGGGEGPMTQSIRRALSDGFGWHKHEFEIKKTIDGELTESVTHEIDHVKRFDGGVFALEIEWNNKDPFFDRDLENFKRLHADGAISIGAIITRGASLHEGMRDLVEQFARKAGISSIDKLSPFYRPTERQVNMIEASAVRAGSFEAGWAQAFVSDKFGEATTHWRKLDDRVRRGVGNPCPLLLVGIPKSVVTL